MNRRLDEGRGQRHLGTVLLWLFVVSGFAGLIYQSMWAHYLGLALGHAAYAQGLVLAIFMGGMALGAWLAGRSSVRWRRLLLMYAAAEALIGVFALGFQPLFEQYSAVSQATILPALGSGLAGRLYPWVSTTLLILPACILLGATFPLLSAGYLRAVPDAPGRVFGGLYFANGLGAAAGALAATFLLLPALGLPGAMRFAGYANLVVAVAAVLVSRHLREGVPLAPSSAGSAPPEPATTPLATQPASGGVDADPGAPPPTRASGAWPRVAAGLREQPLAARALVGIAFLSGAFSFVYEIGWIRLLNQSLGTTLHAFELMLAAFLLGLAFGGLWVRRYVRAHADVVRIAGFAQVWMGISALLSVVVFAQSFEWVGWMMSALSRNDTGYLLFSLGSAAIAIVVMLPAAFFAGMTLPLFTMAIVRGGSGEAGIGRIYAANTLGAIAGVMLMMHVLIPLVGVRVGITLAAMGDALLGLWLLAHARRAVAPRVVGATALLLAGVLVVSLVMGRMDPREQAAGVFRSGVARLSDESQVPFLRDGKTATVAVVRSAANNSAAIITNGKSDAAMALDLDTAPTGDEFTMVMLGALPLAVHPQPRSVGVIGWGSGLSTHTLLGSPVVERVETVEIEPAIHAGARLFGNRVGRAYDDLRSQVHFDDARRHFASGQRQYDVIVSEPSNPWVNGVSSLFTREFYAFLRGHLADDGVLVQWLQSYEIDDALLATIMAALLEEFPQAELYLAHNVDLVIVAYPDRRHRADYARLDHPGLVRELSRVGLANQDELDLRRIGGSGVLRNFVRAHRAVVHSDYQPTVALRAPATRFRGDFSETLQLLVDNGLPVLDVLEGRRPVSAAAPVSTFGDHRFTLAHATAVDIARAMAAQVATTGKDRISDGEHALRWEALMSMSRQQPVEDVALWAEVASALAEASIGHLPAEDLQGAWIKPAWISLDESQPLAVRRLMAMYAAAAARDAGAMRRDGEAVLELSDNLPMRAQEHALVVAQLGAIGTGDFASVERLREGYGVAIPASEQFRMVRHQLRVWALERRR